MRKVYGLCRCLAVLSCLTASAAAQTPPTTPGPRAHDAAQVPSAAAAPAAEVHNDDATVHRLGRRLRCPVCQGLSIGDSPAPMAQDMMRQVRKMQHAGRTEEDIVAYFTSRYGTWVLLDPPKEGAGLWVWVAPPVMLVAGLALALGALRRRVSTPAHNDGRTLARADEPQAPASSQDGALSAIRREVRR